MSPLRRIRPHVALATAAATSVAAFAADTAKPTITEPVKNFRLPTFTAEGFRHTVIRAGEALLPDPARIDAREVEITLFTGDADERIEAMLAASAATIFTERQFAQGSETVRVERIDLTVTGADWSYDHPGQKIIIGRDAHVVFRNAILGDILK